MLRQRVDAGVSDCVMEVSSHALAQHRVWGCQFGKILFTNLTKTTSIIMPIWRILCRQSAAIYDVSTRSRGTE